MMCIHNDECASHKLPRGGLSMRMEEKRIIQIERGVLLRDIHYTNKLPLPINSQGIVSSSSNPGQNGLPSISSLELRKSDFASLSFSYGEFCAVSFEEVILLTTAPFES